MTPDKTCLSAMVIPKAKKVQHNSCNNLSLSYCRYRLAINVDNVAEIVKGVNVS
jgi:hypothetical protein